MKTGRWKHILRGNLEIPAGVSRRFAETLAALGAEPTEAAAVRTAKRRHPVRRVVLIAAAVLLTMTATALAVSPELREAVGRIVQNADTNEFDAETMAYPISGKVMEYIRTHELENPLDLYTVAFSSLAEAADFFDVPLLHNPLLTKFVKLDEFDNPYARGPRVPFPAPYDNPYTFFSYSPEAETVFVGIRSYLTLGNGDTLLYYINFTCSGRTDAGASMDGGGWYNSEFYTSPANGIEAFIGKFRAIFVRDNIMYNLEIVRPQDYDGVTDAVKAVIDAFEP